MNEQEAINILKCAIKKPNTEDGYLGQSIHMAISALEKQIPKKSTDCKREYDELLELEYDQYYCDCGSRIYKVQLYCENCGQKLDWSE